MIYDNVIKFIQEMKEYSFKTTDLAERTVVDNELVYKIKNNVNPGGIAIFDLDEHEDGYSLMELISLIYMNVVKDTNEDNNFIRDIKRLDEMVKKYIPITFNVDEHTAVKPLCTVNIVPKDDRCRIDIEFDEN